MFCWPCILVSQYNEINAMHFSLNLLRITSIYVFRALLTHPQEALNKLHLVYCVRIISVGCATIALQTWHNQLTLYTHSMSSSVCEAPAEDEQVMLETCIGSWFSINGKKSWCNYTEIIFTCHVSDNTLSFSKETSYSQIMCGKILKTRRNFKHALFFLEN
jgi:hypothetical protein